MPRRQKRTIENLSVPTETEFLVKDVEELVNDHVDEYLDGYPFKIAATDFNPIMIDGKLPSGIRRISNNYVSKIAPGEREFSGVDLHIEFPIVSSSENPLNITFKWSDGIQCRIAIVDKQPILLVEQGENTDEVLFSAILAREEMTSYLNSCGLPESMWSASLKELLADINSSRDIRIQRRSNAVIDPYTNMEFIHDARYMTNDQGTKELVQELCLNVDHLDGGSGGEGNNLYLPPKPTFRNMLRFERNEAGDAWAYRGAYEGKLGAGEFIDETVQLDPKLGLPKSKVLIKALKLLEQRPY